MRLRGEFCSLWSEAGADFALWLCALPWPNSRSEGIMGLPGRVQTGGMLRNTGTGFSAAREPRRELEAPLPVDTWRDAEALLAADTRGDAATVLAADTRGDAATVLAVDAWRDAATVLTADASLNLRTLASQPRLPRKAARASRASAARRSRS
tara:strand:- start:1171 stop:1629 length:459 start_codon:yes stop_codon:yes gene_type:complete